MKYVFPLFICLIFIIVSSCYYTEESYPSKSFNVMTAGSLDLKVIAGHAEKVAPKNDQVLYAFEFDKVRGGNMKLFNWVFKETGHGYVVRRLRLLDKHAKLVKEYAINELEKMEGDTIHLP
jgi:hypothetical protein